MRREEIELYRCPATRTPLALEGAEGKGGEIATGALRSGTGAVYPVRDGIPDLTYPPVLSEQDASVRSFYDDRSGAYDQNLHLTFLTHDEDEEALRNTFIDALALKPGSRVLEVACGTGRDSELIAGRLGAEGQLCLQDISAGMLAHCRARLEGASVPRSYCLSNASYLPYPDGYFDAVYSFGGLGEFSDIRRSLAEMVRVSKVGAKIVVGDESMPPWLRNTEFSRILTETNKQFEAEVPLRELPVEARDVHLRWVIGGVFYLIEFTVGEGEPKGNFDFPIPGARGGTLRTRYYGKLEGVTPEVKQLAERARQESGQSMHAWLDGVVKEAALRTLQGSSS